MKLFFSGGSTRSTEIDRFEVDESSSKGETMVEVMRRMKEQFKARELEKAERQRQQYHNNDNNNNNNNDDNNRYDVRARARPAVLASNSNSRNHLATNTQGGGRVWNRGNNIANKARAGTQRPFRGSSLAGESDLDADDDEGGGEDDETESYESGKIDGHKHRMIAQRFENKTNDNDHGKANHHGNKIDAEDQYSFAGTAGRRIDQAVMEALQISRGSLYLQFLYVYR